MRSKSHPLFTSNIPRTTILIPLSIPNLQSISFYQGSTSILTRCPSPLLPLSIAVTTTRVSALTKFRIHRCVSFACGWAYNSNLRACVNANGRRRNEVRKERGYIAVQKEISTREERRVLITRIIYGGQRRIVWI